MVFKGFYSMVHCACKQVLHLEQMLTTGGGWQDQVGGLTPGIKIGHSKAELPVKIDVTFLAVPKDAVEAFSDRLILIYTGKTRLAKNLLQVSSTAHMSFDSSIHVVSLFLY